MRHRELRIDGDGLLKMRDRGRTTMRVHGDFRRTVRFQSFQRRRGCLLQRRRVLLDRGQRLAQPGPDLKRNSAQRTQTSSFLPASACSSARTLRCCSSWRAATTRTGFPGLQSSLPEPRCCRCAHRSPGRPPELAASLAGRFMRCSTCWILLVRDESEERGLFQLHRQPLPKRLVKDRIARLVFEIGQDNGVLRGESWRPVKVKIRRARPAPESPRRRQLLYAVRLGRVDRRQFLLQLGRGLPPFCRVLFQTPVYDSFPASAAGCAFAAAPLARPSTFRRARSRMSRYPSVHPPACPPAAPAPCRRACPSTIWLAVTVSSWPERASPKSRTLTPDFPIMMLPGLRSR